VCRAEGARGQFHMTPRDNSDHVRIALKSLEIQEMCRGRRWYKADIAARRVSVCVMAASESAMARWRILLVLVIALTIASSHLSYAEYSAAATDVLQRSYRGDSQSGSLHQLSYIRTGFMDSRENKRVVS